MSTPEIVRRWAHIVSPAAGLGRAMIAVTETDDKITDAVAAFIYPADLGPVSVISSLMRLTGWWPEPGAREVLPGYWVVPVLRAASLTWMEPFRNHGVPRIVSASTLDLADTITDHANGDPTPST